jgi:hypothetical protein
VFATIGARVGPGVGFVVLAFNGTEVTTGLGFGVLIASGAEATTGLGIETFAAIGAKVGAGLDFDKVEFVPISTPRHLQALLFVTSNDVYKLHTSLHTPLFRQLPFLA